MRTFTPTHRSVPQGRRPTVASTSARRFPSARRRPGVGSLPARHSAARVTPRLLQNKRFQVYGEDEFFACTDAPLGPVADPPSSVAEGNRRPPIGPRAICGIAMAGLIVALTLAVALNPISTGRTSRRKAVPRAGGTPPLAGQTRGPIDPARGRPRARPRSVRSALRATPRAPRAIFARVGGGQSDEPIAVSRGGANESRYASNVSSVAEGGLDPRAGESAPVDSGPRDVERPVGRGEFGFEH